VGNLTSNDVAEDTRVTGSSDRPSGASDGRARRPVPARARQNGQWVRAYPSKTGTFDCSSGNLATVELNITM